MYQTTISEDSHYKYAHGSHCDLCLKRVPIRGGFPCSDCQAGTTHDIYAFVDYNSPIKRKLYQHSKYFTLYVEAGFLQELPDGFCNGVTKELGLQLKYWLICYGPEFPRDERLVDMAVEKLESDGMHSRDINRDRVRDLIFPS